MSDWVRMCHVRDSIVDGGGGANAPSLGTYGLYVETNAPRITSVLVERSSASADS